MDNLRKLVLELVRVRAWFHVCPCDEGARVTIRWVAGEATPNFCLFGAEPLRQDDEYVYQETYLVRF